MDITHIATPEFRAEFRAWLDAAKPGETVGVTDSQFDCPLATFLYERIGADISVDGYTIHIDADRIITPKWADEFVSRIDDVEEFEQLVTRERALEVLNGID